MKKKPDFAGQLKEAMIQAKIKMDKIIINRLAAGIQPGIQDSVRRLIIEFPFSKN